MSGKKILRARNKYYLVDAALRNATLLRGEEILTNPEEMGVIAETTGGQWGQVFNCDKSKKSIEKKRTNKLQYLSYLPTGRQAHPGHDVGYRLRLY